MTTDDNIIDQLVRYGYLSERRASMRLTDDPVREALSRYQDFCFYPLDAIVRKRHGRLLVPDGDVGPATRELFSMPRCELPDFGPGSGNELAGSGSWPMPCQKKGVKYHVDWTGAPRAVLDRKDELERKWVELWRRVGVKLVKVASAAEANIYTHFGSFFGSTIGLASFNGRSCSDRCSLKMSSSYVGENLGLWKHEGGHTMNLGHTRGGTMNSYILDEEDPDGLWLPSDPSWSTIVRFFDGVPVPDDDFVMPPAPDAPDGPAPPIVTPTPKRTLIELIRELLKDWW